MLGRDEVAAGFVEQARRSAEDALPAERWEALQQDADALGLFGLLAALAEPAPVADATIREELVGPIDRDLKDALGKLTLDRLQANGAIVLACNMAFGRMLGMVMQQDKSTPQAAREKAMGMMLPGVILQPNGIFGITLAQQNGCVFVNAV